jgi:hypothetical protein
MAQASAGAGFENEQTGAEAPIRLIVGIASILNEFHKD